MNSEAGPRGGIWWCRRCGEVIGVVDAAGRLWLAASVAATYQRYENAGRAVCRCGEANVWRFRREPAEVVAG